MTDQVSFKTYFSLGSEEISIYVKDIISSEIIFFKKRKLEKGKEDPFENEIQSFFLEKISEIEKQIKLFFDDLESAEKFAKKNNYDYEVLKPNTRSLIKKSYAENFTKK